jgi:hypothetical protein
MKIMAKFSPINFMYAHLKPGERHLNSFIGQTCEWEVTRKYLIFGETTGYFPRASSIIFNYRGHITNKRIILEFPKKINNFAALMIKILGEISETNVGKIMAAMSESAITTNEKIEGMSEGRNFLSFKFKKISKVICYSDQIFWVVLKSSDNELGIPFIPRYINEKGEMASGDLFSLFSEADDVKEFSKIISSHLRLENINDAIRV